MGINFRQPQVLWAKKAKDGDMLWLPLPYHLADTAEIARKLWNNWLSEGIKQTITEGIAEANCAEKLLFFLAAAHDIGKATPVFQAKRSGNIDLDERISERILAAGLQMRPIQFFRYAKKTPHALATQILLKETTCNKQAAVILGAHHGKPPSRYMLNTCDPESFPENYFLGKEGLKAWQNVQRELIHYALELASFSSLKDVPVPNMAAQVLLTGLVIMADWIASDETYLPLIRLEDTTKLDAHARAEQAWNKLELPCIWTPDNRYMRAGFCKKRFGFEPNAVQSAVEQVVNNIRTPGILILEAPMGAGKTEAALLAAEAFAAKSKQKGIFFALPTQATSNGIFPRILDFIEHLDSAEDTSLRLVHGKAQLNPDFQNLASGTGIGEDEESGVFVHEWFEGRKKSMLDDFVVGTIDQLLFAALKQKHVMLRHLGLANKVVIIDECHAYDAYMSQYLYRALNWLGAYHVPVIVLSATLPVQKRQDVIDAYLSVSSYENTTCEPLKKGATKPIQPPDWRTSRSYPLLTYTDGIAVKQKTIPADGDEKEVDLTFLADSALIDKLDDLLSGGGCAGIIVNTVNRAQELARQLRAHFGTNTVQLFHSRFLALDRAQKENELLHALGKPSDHTTRPEKYIVVGTQVLEQSLDIDFDVLFTDICPMDLLLQRIGRLHRHTRNRPPKLQKAICLITGLDGDGFEAGTEAIYGSYLLLRTKALLPKRLTLPEDIPTLVQTTYDDHVNPLPDSDICRKAKQTRDKHLADQKNRADNFRVCAPDLDWDETIIGWLDTSASDHAGEAAVRDTDESIEVLVVQHKEVDNFCFLPWIHGGESLSPHETPDDEHAKTLACCTVHLPRALCGPWIIDQTIQTLEQLYIAHFPAWMQSPWLKGALFLSLDEAFSMDLCGYRLTYSQDDGLFCEKEDHTDA